MDPIQLDMGDMNGMGEGELPGQPEQSPQELYGENLENLPEELQVALQTLVAKFEKENIQARVEEVRRVQRQREFFKGNQNIYWNGTEKRWSPVTISGGLNTSSVNDQAEDAIRYDFVENIYRAHALINIAVLSQNPPHAEFLPQNPAQPEDVATAKAALDVATLISDNNTLDERQAEVCWYFFNDGMCASYTFYDVSGDRYGWRRVDDIQSVMGKVTPDQMRCGCGAAEDLPDQDYSDPMSMGAMPSQCAQCAQPMGPENFAPGTMAAVPQVVGTKEYPRGQERIIYMGSLELARPFFAKNLEECPWITWEVEVHKSWIKSVYPHVAEKLKTNSEGAGDSSELTARSARITLAATSYGRQASEGWSGLDTFRRTWLRPWAFAFVDDESIRKRLMTLFPDGAYVAFAGSTYCEARSEKLESRWALKHPFPGDGMIRDGIGTDLVDVQRRLNTEENIQTETFERGIPSRFIDDSTVDFDAYVSAGALACQDFPATPKPGQRLADAFYDTPPAVVSPQMIAHIENLRGPVPQFLTGNVPTVFGGDTGSNDTASGISMIKDAALGRLALFKRALNDFYAATMLNAIACFKANRTEDVQAAISGATADLDSIVIRLDDLRGNLYARTDAEESYPISIPQKRALIQSFMASPNPQIQAAVLAPDNFAMFKAAMGMQDLKIPGEDARRKQFRELRQLVQGIPVLVDVLMDQHDIEMGALSEWWSSDEGQQACQDPQVAEMVRTHMYAHMSGKTQQMQLIQGMAAPLQPQPGPGGQEPPVQ